MDKTKAGIECVFCDSEMMQDCEGVYCPKCGAVFIIRQDKHGTRKHWISSDVKRFYAAWYPDNRHFTDEI